MDIKFYKSQVVSWFGTSMANKPRFIIRGTLQAVLQAEFVEVAGTRHIKDTIGTDLITGRKELDF